jgi:thiamine-phosphate pyrophosphorylase
MLLCYITDRRQFMGHAEDQKRQLLEKIAECAAAGVDYIQLREKDLTARQLLELAREALLRIPKGATTKLLINSRIDVALASNAHGVHLPADDLSGSDARAIFGTAGNIHAQIGVSTHTVEEVAYAEAHGADLAVFGPVFEKKSESINDGLERLKKACWRPRVGSPMPLLALGGITLENAFRCIEAGAVGVAGIRLFQEKSAKEIVDVLSSGRSAG